ncbi:MAG TPA: histidine kinase dimerization/phospho-acceptor domain-containing protein, partial [Phenylobacterium sp.]|nr:histidine kinase dimerization/phospho-acceptor domain-containing protein [Phenylobacterium sp.]
MPQAHGRDGPIFAALGAAAAGAAVLAGLAALGRLDLEAAIGGAVLTLAAGALIGWRTAARADLAPNADEGPQLPGRQYAPPYASLIEALPDPLLVVAAEEPDDLTGRRFILANRAARDLLRIQNDTGLLVTAIRDPEVLEATDEALFGQTPSEAIYEMGGAQERVLKAIALPLATAPDGVRLALLVLRDETDIRRAERTRADFLANASHELRTPLASLAGFIETLRGHARTDEAARGKFLAI